MYRFDAQVFRRLYGARPDGKFVYVSIMAGNMEDAKAKIIDFFPKLRGPRDTYEISWVSISEETK